MEIFANGAPPEVKAAAEAGVTVYLNERAPGNSSSKKKHSSKSKAVELYEEMAVHIEGAFPDRLITTRRPHEGEDILKYRKANYEPITKGGMQEAVDSLHRIYNDLYYSINSNSEEFLEYINSNVFDGFTYMGYVQNRLTKQMLLDPNAWLVVLPTGEGLTQSNVSVKPVVVEVPCTEQYMQTPDFIMFRAVDEYEMVEGANYKAEYSGAVFYIVTTSDIYRVRQIGKKSDNNFTVDFVYTHGQNSIPYVVLGGEWVSTARVYESFFAQYVPNANEAIRQYSDWQGSMVTCAYPIRVIKYVDCTNPECHGGYVSTEGGSQEACGVCNGAGKIIPSSPYGVIMREDVTDIDEQADKTPPIEFVSPDTSILQYSKDAWNEQLETAKNNLHIYQGYAGESAEARLIGQEREYAMINKISNNVYDNLVAGVLDIMAAYMDVNGNITIQVTKPKEFQLKSASDLRDEVKALKEAGAPQPVIKEATRNYLLRKFDNNEKAQNEQLFLLDYDPLYTYGLEEKISLNSVGVVPEEDLYSSVYAPQILRELLRKQKIELADIKYERLAELLTAAVKERYDAMLEKTTAANTSSRNAILQAAGIVNEEVIPSAASPQTEE